MKRAATYARFSTDRQSESSIDEQRAACRQYAESNRLEIVREFADLAISGAAMGNRPEVQALEKLALAGAIEVILLADLTRLSRSNADLARFLERMRFRRIRVIGVLDRFDSDLRVARMQAGLSGIMSDEYRAAIGERTHLALDARARAARPTGSRAYGYSSRQEVIPAQAEIVREIFRRVAAGETMRAVCADLNVRGVPSPGAGWKRSARRRDGRWIVPALNALLQNELYIGRVIWNRSQWVKDPESGRRVRRERPRADWVVQERPELAIVDTETFAAIAQRMGQRKLTGAGGRGGAPKFPLSGLLECGECGGKYVISGGGKNSRGYGASGTRYYVYSTYHTGGDSACANRLRVTRALAEERLFAPPLEQLLSEAAIETAIGRIRKLWREQPEPALVAVDGAADLDRRIAAVRALVEQGALERELAEPVFAKLEAERVRVERAARRANVVPLAAAAVVEEEYRDQARKLRDDLTGEDAVAARAALMTLYGPRIRLVPEEGDLVAEVELRADAVVAAAARGSTGRIWIGSGGPLWHFRLHYICRDTARRAGAP